MRKSPRIASFEEICTGTLLKTPGAVPKQIIEKIQKKNRKKIKKTTLTKKSYYPGEYLTT